MCVQHNPRKTLLYLGEFLWLWVKGFGCGWYPPLSVQAHHPVPCTALLWFRGAGQGNSLIPVRDPCRELSTSVPARDGCARCAQMCPLLWLRLTPHPSLECGKERWWRRGKSQSGERGGGRGRGKSQALLLPGDVPVRFPEQPLQLPRIERMENTILPDEGVLCDHKVSSHAFMLTSCWWMHLIRGIAE